MAEVEQPRGEREDRRADLAVLARADAQHLAHHVARILHAAQQMHGVVDVEVDHGYIVFAPRTGSKTAYRDVVAQM